MPIDSIGNNFTAPDFFNPWDTGNINFSPLAELSYRHDFDFGNLFETLPSLSDVLNFSLPAMEFHFDTIDYAAFDIPLNSASYSEPFVTASAINVTQPNWDYAGDYEIGIALKGLPSGKNSGGEFGSALANQFKPDDKLARQLFGSVQNLDLLLQTKKPPPDRFEEGFGKYDSGFQYQASKLVDAGVIKPGVLVISDTGHDIPIMETLMGSLDMSGTLALPNFRLDGSGNGARVVSQAQTFGNKIAAHDKRNSADGKVTSYFLGIDTHRSEEGVRPFNAAKLPVAGKLKNAGVNKIVVLVEAGPGKKSIEATADDIQPYLKKIQSEGIKVEVYGVDYRR